MPFLTHVKSDAVKGPLLDCGARTQSRGGGAATPLHTTGLQLHGIMGVRSFGSALCLQQPVCLGLLVGIPAMVDSGKQLLRDMILSLARV